VKNLLKLTIVIAASVAFIFLVSMFGLGMDSFFKPKYRAMDNKVFKESEQYNDGMIRDLENLRMDYINGDETKKQALKAVILHRFSVYSEEKMSYDLRSFYQQLKKGN